MGWGGAFAFEVVAESAAELALWVDSDDGAEVVGDAFFDGQLAGKSTAEGLVIEIVGGEGHFDAEEDGVARNGAAGHGTDLSKPPGSAVDKLETVKGLLASAS